MHAPRTPRARRAGATAIALALAVAAAAMSFAARADAAATPGAALRTYLDARWKGDLAAAEAAWDAVDLRRSQGFGTRYTGLEARYDDNLLWTAEARAAFAAAGRPAIADSSVSEGQAVYTVVVRRTAGADTLRYGVRSTGGDWRACSAFEVATRAWNLREGRFVRVRAERLRDVNADAVASLDAGVERILQRLAAPEQTRLRLERLKIEYALCRDAASVRALCGSRPGGYQLAGERVISSINCDLAAVARLLVHVVAKEIAPYAAPVLDEGTAATLGGTAGESDAMVAQRGAALLAAGSPAPESVLDPARSASLQAASRLPLSAAWAGALLGELGGERFLTLYGQLSAAADPARAFDAAAVRERFEAATGKRGAALGEWLRAKMSQTPNALRAGCGERIPIETQTLKPILRWRDEEQRWSLEAFPVGDDYVFVVQPYVGGMPAWAQRLADSLAVARGGTVTPRPEPKRPAGDPPQIALILRRRVYSEPEAYESALFPSHFRNRKYAGDVFGLFIGVDSVRLWDYRRDTLVAGIAPDFAPALAKSLYDKAPGRICFRLRRELLGMPMEEFVATSVPYTGE